MAITPVRKSLKTLQLTLLQQSRLQLLRSPFPGQKDLLWLEKLSFFHTLAKIPLNKDTLGIHQVERVFAQWYFGLSFSDSVVLHN
jgi:hypothetical protein